MSLNSLTIAQSIGTVAQKWLNFVYLPQVKSNETKNYAPRAGWYHVPYSSAMYHF